MSGAVARAALLAALAFGAGAALTLAFTAWRSADMAWLLDATPLC